MERLSIFLLVLCGFIFSGVNAQANEQGRYTLHPGDKLQISVWREETLDKKIIVLPDGSITFPLVGSVMVEGLSSIEVEKLLSEKLQNHVPEAEVTVMITAVSGNRVFVIGKVKSPGEYILTSSMNVAQILSLAGGLDRFADTDGIKVLRTEGQSVTYYKYDYGDLLSGKSVDSVSFLLKAGDVVIVP